MNTVKTVFDFRKNNGIAFSEVYCINHNGTFDCASGESFQEEAKNYDNLTDDEKLACDNFLKSMDKKYGKQGHDYRKYINK